MTLEEQAEKFLAEKDISDFVVWRNDNLEGWDLGILLEEFARQVAKAKLEEAAERATLWIMEGNKSYDLKSNEIELEDMTMIWVNKESITKTLID